jgi:hypothetical protein
MLSHTVQHLPSGHNSLDQVQSCSIKNLQRNTSFLDGVMPISAKDFIRRRDRLAGALHEMNIDAFVLEPGFTFQYYGNVSQLDWEPWGQYLS